MVCGFIQGFVGFHNGSWLYALFAMVRSFTYYLQWFMALPYGLWLFAMIKLLAMVSSILQWVYALFAIVNGFPQRLLSLLNDFNYLGWFLALHTIHNGLWLYCYVWFVAFRNYLNYSQWFLGYFAMVLDFTRYSQWFVASCKFVPHTTVKCIASSIMYSVTV